MVGELEGVVDEVAQHLLELGTIGTNEDGCGIDLPAKHDVALLPVTRRVGYSQVRRSRRARSEGCDQTV